MRFSERWLRTLVAEGGKLDDSAAVAPLKNPEGLLASLEDWGSKHPEAASGLTRTVVGASKTDPAALPLAPLLTDVMETFMAWQALEEGKVDDFLRLRRTSIFTAPDGTTKWAALTAITDREALVREIVGTTSARPHLRAEPPSIDLHLAEAHTPEELRAALGLSLRQALEVDERPPSEAAGTLFKPVIRMVRGSSPELGEGLEWLMKNDPRALLEMPTTVMLVDAVQGNPEPRVGMRLRFAHLLELAGLGYCVFLMWDTEARLTRKERAALAGYVRQLCNTAVAPWNRYPDLRRRRETFAIWLRHLRDERVDAPQLADLLRSHHPGDYANEARATTIKRIYRISTELSSVRMPQGLMKLVREARELGGPDDAGTDPDERITT